MISFSEYAIKAYKRQTKKPTLNGFVKFLDSVFDDNPVVGHGLSHERMVMRLQDGQEVYHALGSLPDPYGNTNVVVGQVFPQGLGRPSKTQPAVSAQVFSPPESSNSGKDAEGQDEVTEATE